ncbi:type II secretion system protein XpsI [Lysobacter changpingensis]|uniref:type II secretion system protein XpsI n=1 Tax=Lysobacter changpingensis TaxID=2792784 RepID=UPI001F5DC48E|nr:prepilin-type N-terminal cleavage/methylation domain-containing protein [Lysobacter changpingensis]
MNGERVERNGKPVTATRRCALSTRSSFLSARSSLQTGYTLLEVIVAFALLAMALTLLLGILSGSTRQVRQSADAGRAAMYAQSVMDQVGVGERLAASERDGEFEQGRYRWRLRVAPWRDPAVAASGQPMTLGGPELFEITLAMQWGDGPGQRLQLRTLRIAAAGSGGVLP